MMLGFLNSKQWFLSGAATMLLVIILVVVDAFLGLSRHNLFGIELMVYMILVLPGILGAWIGHLIRQKFFSTKDEFRL